MSKELTQAVLSAKAVFANNFMATMVDGLIRISFGEFHEKEDVRSVHTSIIMTADGFIAMMGLLIPQYQNIVNAANKSPAQTTLPIAEKKD